MAGDYFRFLTAVLLGLFIRGGVLAFPVLSNGTSQNILPLTLVAAAFCVWLGAIIIVPLAVLRLQLMNWITFGTLLIGYTILLRLIFLDNIELIQNEAYYWNYSQHMCSWLSGITRLLSLCLSGLALSYLEPMRLECTLWHIYLLVYYNFFYLQAYKNNLQR